MTKQKWIATATVSGVILTLIGLGFAAMSTNPPFVIPDFIPWLFFSLASLVTLALIVYLTWERITGIPYRFQVPIININQRGNNNVASLNTAPPVKQWSPVELIHDGVVWLDTGTTQYGHIYASGPFCPKDKCLLGIRDRNGLEQVRADYHNNVVVSDAPYDTFVHGSGSFVILFCHECKAEYTLGANPKNLGQSREEVETLFEAKRRRDATI